MWDVRKNPKFGYLEIWGLNGGFRPIRDTGEEYNPDDGRYGRGINKASAHVLCK